MKKFYSLFDYTGGNVKFRSFRVAIDAAISLAACWDALCAAGDSGTVETDLLIAKNDLLIDPLKGSVCFDRSGYHQPLTEQQAEKYELMRFLPPEVIRGCEHSDGYANEYANRYTLSVLIFMFLTGGFHPLEGERSIMPVMRREQQEQLYGMDPVFLFDRKDQSNRPDRKVHYKVEAVWSILPDDLKTAFWKMFEKDGLARPEERLSGREWIRLLAAFQNGITVCDCGNILLLTDGRDTVCEMCGAVKDVPIWIDLGTHRIPAVSGNRIYVYGPEDEDGDEAPDGVKACTVKPIAKVISSSTNSGKLGIRNISGVDWRAITTKGDERIVKNGGVIPLKVGIRFCYRGHTVEIQKK